MGFWSAILEEAGADLTAIVLPTLLVYLPLLRILAPHKGRQVRTVLIFTTLHLLVLPAAALLRQTEADIYRDIRLVCLAFAALALVGMARGVIFSIVLRRLRLAVPKIVQDVALATASAAALFAVASRVGYDISGLLATSAILTAVVGLALQDTLGNVVGGLAIQTDNSIRVGDWIEVGQVSGKVTEIRWRYTAVETRRSETVYLPNSSLVKGQVMVVGKKDGQPAPWRRAVAFNVDFRYPPTEVIRVVEEALIRAPIERVATHPLPFCILAELHESYARYELRYWLTEPQHDVSTDSVVRVRISFALRRAGIPLSIPAQALFLTPESAERKQEKEQAEHDRRVRALAGVDIFRDLSDEDREQLAKKLSYVPFAAGEPITKQGSEAHWLYLVVDGEASVRLHHGTEHERELARVGASNFFGEMSLLTGERRSATVVAITDVECYRLDKVAFEAVVRHRPEIAESVAELLAARRLQISALREQFGKPVEAQQIAAEKGDLLRRIRHFFNLGADEDKRNVG